MDCPSRTIIENLFTTIDDKILFTGNDKFQYLPIRELNSTQENFKINLLNVMALDKANEKNTPKC